MPEDDDLEIQVSAGSPEARPAAKPQPAQPARAAANAAPRRKTPVRRAQTPPEPIETGEIVTERRSLIIRSESNPAIPVQKVEIGDDGSGRGDPTELVRPRRDTQPAPAGYPANALDAGTSARIQAPTAAPAPVPARRGPRYVWLLAAIGPAIAAVALSMIETTTKTKPSTLGIQGAAEMIATTLDGAATAVQARAEAIATSSMLRAAIETDAQTLADMARDQDVAFPLAKGECLEVIQVRDTARTPLLRLPADAPAMQPPPAGKTHLEAQGDKLTLIANAAIAKRPSGTSGEVVLAVPVDLEAIKKRVAEQTTNATLTGLAAPIALATGAKSGESVTLPVPTKLLPASLQLTAAAPAATVSKNQPLVIGRFACMGLAGLLFLMFIGSLFTRKQ